MTLINHTGESTVLDYMFCAMIQAGDIDGVIPLDTKDDTISMLIIGENYTGKVQVSSEGVENITLSAKSRNEQLYESARIAYELSPVKASIRVIETGDKFNIVIDGIRRDA